MWWRWEVDWRLEIGSFAMHGDGMEVPFGPGASLPFSLPTCPCRPLAANARAKTCMRKPRKHSEVFLMPRLSAIKRKVYAQAKNNTATRPLHPSDMAPTAVNEAD